MYVAQFRADTTYTSQITSAVWMDPTRLRIELMPGSREPGGTWSVPPYVTGPALAHVVAAFNGGFRFQDAHGGFYLNGRTAVGLRPGAASLVIYADGRIGVGLWGRDLTMTPDVQAVLQNLALLVDHGQLDPSASYGDTKLWGHTLGANTVVARSGVGVTASGALVYVAGPALTARSLAESLQRAGAVRAMTLDINPEWVTFNLFEHPDPANLAVVTGTKLYPQIQRSARRYLGPTPESRDFFAVIGR
jgi:Phosphodiester glycosidase